MRKRLFELNVRTGRSSSSTRGNITTRVGVDQLAGAARRRELPPAWLAQRFSVCQRDGLFIERLGYGAVRVSAELVLTKLAAALTVVRAAL